MAEIDFEAEDDYENDPEEDLYGDSESDNFSNADNDIDSNTSESLFSRRRIIVVLSIIGVVFLVSFFLFGIRNNKNKPGKNASFSSGYTSLDTKPEKKSKKKKKRIKFEKLYDLTSLQLPDVLRELSLAGIAFKTEQKGKNYSISVDSSQSEKAKNLLAVKGLPSSGARGYQLLDKSQTLGVTEFDKRIRFLRALSEELEKAIMQFDAIDSCKVQIVIPEQRLFAVTQPPVTSSILLRKTTSAKLTDELVFSVIELVSNAVENLQPENISVIGTEGHVLSKGLLERMSKTDRIRRRQKAEQKKVIIQAKKLPKVGQPIIPDFNRIKHWYEVKKQFEESLEDKAGKQLTGILPVGSFKIAITADIGPLEEGKIVDIKRLSASVVVDNANDDIELDTSTKTQIYNTIAASIGYIKKRDSIRLSKANFSLLSQDEKDDLVKKQKHKRLLKLISKYSSIALLAIIVLGIIIFIYRKIKKKKETSAPIMSSESRETDFSDIQDEISSDKKLEEIKYYTLSNPDIIAQIMEEWLTSAKEEVFQ